MPPLEREAEPLILVFKKIISLNLTAEKKEGENFLRYSFFTSEYNIIISQIDNTVIYVEVPIEYQEELEKNQAHWKHRLTY